jgi:hypothetical protein
MGSQGATSRLAPDSSEAHRTISRVATDATGRAGLLVLCARVKIAGKPAIVLAPVNLVNILHLLNTLVILLNLLVNLLLGITFQLGYEAWWLVGCCTGL